MASNADQARSSRKAVMVTAMIAVVFVSAEQADIDWIIRLAGWKAWSFLGILHCYNSYVWYQWRNTLIHDQLGLETTTNRLHPNILLVGRHWPKPAETAIDLQLSRDAKKRMRILIHVPDLSAILGFTVVFIGFARAINVKICNYSDSFGCVVPNPF